MMFLGAEVVDFQAIAAAFLMNIYIVGLNQLTDIEIDKVEMCCYFSLGPPLNFAYSVAITQNQEQYMNLATLCSLKVGILLSCHMFTQTHAHTSCIAHSRRARGKERDGMTLFM